MTESRVKKCPTPLLCNWCQKNLVYRMEKTSNCNPQCKRFLGSTKRIPGLALKSYTRQELTGVG